MSSGQARAVYVQPFERTKKGRLVQACGFHAYMLDDPQRYLDARHVGAVILSTREGPPAVVHVVGEVPRDAIAAFEV